jgi:hypothetical protein
MLVETIGNLWCLTMLWRVVITGNDAWIEMGFH